MKSKLKGILYLIIKVIYFDRVIVSILKTRDLVFLRKLLPPNTMYTIHDVVFCNRYGINYKLHLNDYQSWILYTYSKQDSSFEVLRFINEGDYVLDIGGNIGQTALMMGKKTGKEGQVISFEPFENTFKQFEFNLSLNKSIHNIIPEKIALGDKDEEVELYVENNNNSGGNRVLPKGIQTANPTQVSHLTSLDLYAKHNEKRFSKLNLIKNDVEGFEFKILQGATELINRFKPILFVEVNNKNLNAQGCSAYELIKFIQNLNYSIFDVNTNLKVDIEDFNTDYHTDVYCIYVNT
jgi:FkbM family methyltransferase